MGDLIVFGGGVFFKIFGVGGGLFGVVDAGGGKNNPLFVNFFKNWGGGGGRTSDSLATESSQSIYYSIPYSKKNFNLI